MGLLFQEHMHTVANILAATKVLTSNREDGKAVDPTNYDPTNFRKK
jgi:hypothetical protein